MHGPDFHNDMEFAGLIFFGWDLYEDEPVAAVTPEAWELLDEERAQRVWQKVAEVALDFCADYAIPNTVEDLFPEN